MQKSAPKLHRQTDPSRLLTEHFKCPDDLINLIVQGDLSSAPGYFRFGPDLICFGQCAGGVPAPSATETLFDCSPKASAASGTVRLPFDPVQVVDNLRYERYKAIPSPERKEIDANSLVRKLYYAVRPLLPVGARKYLQRVYFRGWEKIPFPRWPVDFTTERILEQLLILTMRARGIRSMPFIWFWPDGAPSCVVMTHDVETSAGRDFCCRLMDINDSFGIKSAFQVVPEKRYSVPQSLLDEIASRGFELNVHDLNHDGHLMKNREEFLRRAVRINHYGQAFKSSGFRSAMLHRNLEWYDALEFSYDMSVPNVAHLDPQRGGCCTVFPFFNGKLLELPVTMMQDYSLFHILQDFSLDRWKEQIALIMEKHGLMNFIVHPDYILEDKKSAIYEDLLDYLRTLNQREGIWIALPREVDQWWRQRSKMRIVQNETGWGIQGRGSERARIAYAEERNGRLVFTLDARRGDDSYFVSGGVESPEEHTAHAPEPAA